MQKLQEEGSSLGHLTGNASSVNGTKKSTIEKVIDSMPAAKLTEQSKKLAKIPAQFLKYA